MKHKLLIKLTLCLFLKRVFWLNPVLKRQSYSFSVGSEFRTIETVGVSFKSDNIKDRFELIKRYFIGGYNIVLCGEPNNHLFITV